MGAQPVHPDGDDAVMRDLRRQAHDAPHLAAGEKMSLLEKSAHGDRGSQERLVAANLELVIRLAQDRAEKGLSVPDLVQEGSLGLVEALRTFAGSGETDFEAFATERIGRQMDAALADEAAAVREGELLVAAANDFERTELLLRRELQRQPNAREIAEKLEWSLERTEYVAQVVGDARRRHDEELLAFIDPEAIDLDEPVDGE